MKKTSEIQWLIRTMGVLVLEDKEEELVHSAKDNNKNYKIYKGNR